MDDQSGSIAAPVNPLLGPLRDNGGRTFTMALLPGSPAIGESISAGEGTDQCAGSRPLDRLAKLRFIGKKLASHFPWGTLMVVLRTTAAFQGLVDLQLSWFSAMI